MLRYKVSIICFLVLLASTAFANAPKKPASQQRPDPAAIMPIIQHAIDSKNATLFKQYVNIKGTVARGMSVAIEETQAYLSSSDVEPMEALLLGAMVAGGTPEKNTLVKKLQQETEEFILSGVHSGKFAGEETIKQESTGLFQMIFANISPGRKSFSAGRTLSQNATAAKVASTLHDASTGDEFPLELVLEWNNEESVWRLCEVGNLQSQIQRLRNEHKNR